MTQKASFPSLEELPTLPVHGFDGFLKFYNEENFKLKERGEPGPFRLLATAPDFAELVDTLANFRVSPRLLRAYTSPNLGLLSPPVHRNGSKDHYVYPDHFEGFMFILTLRRVYHLPLKAIRQILEHLPADMRHVVTARKLSTEDLLDLAKMMPKGFTVKDLVMAKACDMMLEDVLPSGQALIAATEPGNALQDLEEKLMLGRLVQIKEWIKTGRRQKFVRREAAEDFKDLAENRLLVQKIRRKILSRQARDRSGIDRGREQG